MVSPTTQRNGWNHDAIEEESKHDVQGALPRPEGQANLAASSASSEQFSGMTGMSPRRRSMSVASAHPSVETVVSKAKRAASTLWTLLHAQVG